MALYRHADNSYQHIEKIQNEALMQTNRQLQEKNRLLRLRIAELETEIEQLKIVDGIKTIVDPER